jgi:hypothetical protein
MYHRVVLTLIAFVSFVFAAQSAPKMALLLPVMDKTTMMLY